MISFNNHNYVPDFHDLTRHATHNITLTLTLLWQPGGNIATVEQSHNFVTYCVSDDKLTTVSENNITK